MSEKTKTPTSTTSTDTPAVTTEPKTAAAIALEAIAAQKAVDDAIAADQQSDTSPEEPAANAPIIATLKKDFEYHNGTFRNSLKAGAELSSQHYNFARMLQQGAKLEATYDGVVVELDASLFE